MPFGKNLFDKKKSQTHTNIILLNDLLKKLKLNMECADTKNFK